MKMLALVLVVIGAINWGLVGLLKIDLVAAIFGELSLVSRVVYTLVGLGGIYTLFTGFSGKEIKQ